MKLYLPPSSSSLCPPLLSFISPPTCSVVNCVLTSTRSGCCFYSICKPSKKRPYRVMPILASLPKTFFFSLHSGPSMAQFNASISSTITAPKKARLRGVVFDMDGTLTVPVIDFAAMYKAVLGEEEYKIIRSKNPSGIDILHHIETFSPDQQTKAYQIIADFERQGLDRLQIMPGAKELCGHLDSKQIRRGLITRNVKEAVDLFHLRFGITFFPALSREFRPYKPDPAPLLHICSTWDIHPNEVMMVGDSLKDDIVCGSRAGAFTCLLDETGRYTSADFEAVDHKPDFKVSSLDEVYTLLDTNFELNPQSPNRCS